MAKHTADVGRGSKPDKIIRDALLLELNREDLEDGKKVKKLQRIVRKIVACAAEGKMDAVNIIFDRVEGKPTQDIAVEHSGELTLRSVIVSELNSFFADATRRLEDRSNEDVVSN